MPRDYDAVASAKGTLQKNRSPKWTAQPLPKVPPAPPKRSYDKTAKKLDKAVKDNTTQFFATMKAARVPKPQFPSTQEEIDMACKMVNTLYNPPKLTPANINSPRDRAST